MPGHVQARARSSSSIPGYTMYGNVTEADMVEIVEQHLVKNRPVARLAIQEDHLYNRFFRIFGDAKFFGKQMRIALRNCGVIDPESIDDYLALRGLRGPGQGPRRR